LVVYDDFYDIVIVYDERVNVDSIDFGILGVVAADCKGRVECWYLWGEIGDIVDQRSLNIVSAS
jgi:hypothetical protein